VAGIGRTIGSRSPSVVEPLSHRFDYMGDVAKAIADSCVFEELHLAGCSAEIHFPAKGGETGRSLVRLARSKHRLDLRTATPSDEAEQRLSGPPEGATHGQSLYRHWRPSSSP
jgi:hypothetical protein